MPKPQKHTDIFIITKKLFSDVLGGLQSISKLAKRPCKAFDVIDLQYEKRIWKKILNKATNLIK